MISEVEKEVHKLYDMLTMALLITYGAMNQIVMQDIAQHVEFCFVCLIKS